MSSQKPRKAADRRVNATAYQFGFIQRLQHNMQSSSVVAVGVQDATRAVLDAGLSAIFGDDYFTAPQSSGVPMFNTFNQYCRRIYDERLTPEMGLFESGAVGHGHTMLPPPGHALDPTTKWGVAVFFEGAGQKRDPLEGMGMVVMGRDVLNLYDIANEYANGDVNLARQIISQSPELTESAPGLYNADDVDEAFDHGQRVKGSAAFAKRQAMIAPPKTKDISLYVENAPLSKKISLEDAAATYFGRSETAALMHLKEKGLHKACDRAGQYMKSFFSDVKH